MCPIPLFVLLLQVEDRDSVPNWTDNNVAISGEVQISLAIDCAEQIGKLQNKKKSDFTFDHQPSVCSSCQNVGIQHIQRQIH